MYEPLAWWFFLWGSFLILPLIPTIVIYKLFPETSVTVSGPLSKLTVNATGAFAAYVTTVMLGYFLVSDIAGTLRRMELARWKVVVKLELQDVTGNAIPDARRRQLLSRFLQVATVPPHYRIQDDMITVETTFDPRRPPTV